VSLRVALVTATGARHLDEDLPPLLAALEGVGAAPEIVVWDDVALDWRAFDVAVLRSAWDYAPRRDAFVAWARALPVPLMNGADVVAWNTDKRYLADLAARAVPITPTVWIAKGEPIRVPCERETVVKPAVSGGAMDTARYPAGARAEAEAHVRRLHAEGRVAMVQPYQAAVDVDGETALVFFGGVFSHAVRKGPILVPGTALVEGLFAQETIEPRAPSARERQVAEQALDAVPTSVGGRRGLLYARVDVVPGADGAPLVLELELTEPSVFLLHAPGAADRFAREISDRASGTSNLASHAR
jgi:glutathione synthase/RimK-type ligase-like ATP-grasp enzyme